MSEIKVNSIKGVGASNAAITVNNSDGTCTANLSNRQGKNLVVNGACLIAQRGVSFTASGSFPIDRFEVNHSGTDESPTMSQFDVASGTTPYTLGFRKSLKVTNGNQTSGAGADDELTIRTRLEAQDIANSGWNYTDPNSFITLSYWIKSSVAQNFYGRLRTQETNYNYAYETGSLSANTWTKITKKIAGNSNLQFDNDNAKGLTIEWTIFRGTDHTSSFALDTWLAYTNGGKVPDMTTTWYTTNDATFEITGVQLEVSDHASDFQFRSFAEELALCQRYCNALMSYGSGDTNGNRLYNADYAGGNGMVRMSIPRMRVIPTLTYSIWGGSITYNFSSFDLLQLFDSGDNNFYIYDVLCEAEL